MKKTILLIALLIATLGIFAQTKNLLIAPGKSNASDESLKQYEYPAWFRDAKFGIWAHWGP